MQRVDKYELYPRPCPIGGMLVDRTWTTRDFVEALNVHGVHIDEMRLVLSPLLVNEHGDASTLTSQWEPIPVEMPHRSHQDERLVIDLAMGPGYCRPTDSIAYSADPFHHAMELGASHESGVSRELRSSFTSSRKRKDSKRDAIWWQRYAELSTFKLRHGHCLVGSDHQSENPALVTWVKRMRYQHKLKQEGRPSSLSEERQSALDGLGFVYDSHQVAWDAQYASLQVFREAHGHCNVPVVYRQNPTLGGWVKGQRRAYKQLLAGNRSSMTLRRMELLEAIDFQWSLRSNDLVASSTDSSSTAATDNIDDWSTLA